MQNKFRKIGGLVALAKFWDHPNRSDSRLEFVISRWNVLPKHIQKTIVLLVNDV